MQQNHCLSITLYNIFSDQWQYTRNYEVPNMQIMFTYKLNKMVAQNEMQSGGNMNY